MTSEMWACIICVLVLVSCTSLGSCSICLTQGATDCSTVNPSYVFLYNATAPNHFRLIPPYPQSNTFSCYQTNFESNMCKAFATNFNEEIQVFGEGNHSVKIVSSPSTNDTYPNSIICRYRVTCSMEQLLGYTFTQFDLEDRKNCPSNHEVCLDWVVMKFGHEKPIRHCGRENVNNIEMTGYNDVMLEFVTNQRVQAEGFEIHFRCYNSSIGEDEGEIQEGNHWCTRPPGSHPFIPKGFAYFSTVGHHYIVRRHWNLLFGDETILIVNYSGDIIWLSDGITLLYVDNYVTKKITTYNSNDKSRLFHGYGYLAVYQDKAYYYQTEVKLEFQPSRKEAKVIVLIERALSAAIEQDSLDVEDSDDAEVEFWRTPFWKGQSRAFQNNWSFSTRRNFRNSYVAELALTYGNACNPILRAAACSYQAIVLGMDCSQ